jgi:hypothetical protein
MRERREERQGIEAPFEDQVLEQELSAPQAKYHADGPFPPVSEEMDFDQSRSAGSLAFDVDDYARAQAAPEQKGFHTRTLKGKYGTYTVQFSTVKLNNDEGAKQDAVKIHIAMQADEKLVKSRQVGFVQVTRRSEDGGKSWATNKSQAMSEERVRRTDKKTGYRVDRTDDAKSPFYGASRKDGELTTGSSAKLGKPSGAELKDRPWVFPNHHMEFISTATDTSTGQQYDAISWGYRASASSVEMIEPSIIDTYDERLAGRDRAIHQWNDKIATEDGGIDSVPTQYDPLDAVGLLKTNIETPNKDAARITLENPHNRTAERIHKVKVNYQLETGRSLASDLKKLLDDKDEKKFKDWL